MASSFKERAGCCSADGMARMRMRAQPSILAHRIHAAKGQLAPGREDHPFTRGVARNE